MISEKEKEEYNKYVTELTPNNCLWKDMLNAFWIGGLICTLGQVLMELYSNMGANKEDSASYVTISLVFLSVLLTGLNIYPKIAKVGGAGCLVPITGFANSVAAPAIEFKSEGFVFGVGAKIFTIAGPVILYGIVTSWLAGIVYLFVM